MQQINQINDLKNYMPHIWLKNSHLMTIVGTIARRDKLKQDLPEKLLIPLDHESIVMAHAHLNDSVRRCLVIVHGLEGSSDSIYVRSLTAEGLKLGFNVVRLNLRNCGNTIHLTPTLYNAGQSEDLRKVINWLMDNKGQSEQYVVGYSLGGNLVLKALAEMSGHNLVKAGCVISPSIDLAASVNCLEKGFSRVYSHFFLQSLRKKIELKHKLFPKRYSLKTLAKANSMYNFDNLITAPDAGYTDAEEYYLKASANKLIDQIQINSLIITAQDDPIVPFESFVRINK